MAGSSHWIALAAAVGLNAVAHILVKASSRSGGEVTDAGGVVSMLTHPHVVLGVLAFGVSLAAYTYALRGIALNAAYPILMSVALVIILGWSVAFFGESLSALKLAGIGLIAAGVLLVARAG